MEALRRFRILAVWVTAAAILACAAAVCFFDRLLAETIFVGGVVGIAAFWIEARRSEKALRLGAKEIKAFAYRWAFVRIGLYAMVLLWAHGLDTESARGMLGACLGLFAIRIVLIVMGVMGIGLKDTDDARDKQS